MIWDLPVHITWWLINKHHKFSFLFFYCVRHLSNKMSKSTMANLVFLRQGKGNKLDTSFQQRIKLAFAPFMVQIDAKGT